MPAPQGELTTQVIQLGVEPAFLVLVDYRDPFLDRAWRSIEVSFVCMHLGRTRSKF